MQNLQGSLEPVHRPANEHKNICQHKGGGLVPYKNNLKASVPELQHACQHQAGKQVLCPPKPFEHNCMEGIAKDLNPV